MGYQKEKLCFSAHSRWLKGYSGFTDLIKNQSIGVAKGVLHTLVWILNKSSIGRLLGLFLWLVVFFFVMMCKLPVLIWCEVGEGVLHK